jgi:hypothetical protein
MCAWSLGKLGGKKPKAAQFSPFTIFHILEAVVAGQSSGDFLGFYPHYQSHSLEWLFWVV